MPGLCGPGGAPLVDVEMSLSGFEDEPIYLTIPQGAYSNVERPPGHLVAVDENDQVIPPICPGPYLMVGIARRTGYYAIRMEHRSGRNHWQPSVPVVDIRAQ